jgi:predicted RNase H-like nuclease
MTAMTFIGVDLAWKTDGNHSGIAVLSGDERGVQLSRLSSDITSMAGVVDFVVSHSMTDSVVAVDASLVVNNSTGQRPCETMISKEFGRYHAGCHTTNTAKLYSDTGMKLVWELARRGFVHEFELSTAQGKRGRWLFEVYPHPAMIRLFGLDRIIPYKKGTVADRQRGLRQLRNHLYSLAARQPGFVETPMLDEFLGRELTVLRGKDIKRYEDTLDALFCAYLAWHCWRWGLERNEMFGTLGDGYIVVPRSVAG